MAVIKAQGYVKIFFQIKDAQIVVFKRYWDKVEILWLAQNFKGEEDDKKAKGRKKKKKYEYHIPEAVKMKIIHENLTQRRKEYWKSKSIQSDASKKNYIAEDLKEKPIFKV